MSTYPLARLFSPKVRAALASLVVVFVLAMAAHSGHLHDPAADRTVPVHQVCGFCVAFGGVADTPRPVGLALIASTPSAPNEPGASSHLGRTVETSARPRAPPVS